MKKILIALMLMSLSTGAIAGSLGDETKNLISKGYKIIGSGVQEKGAPRYWIMFENVNAENMIVICQKYYDQKKTKCYDL